MINWLLANWQVVLVVVSAVISGASVAVKAVAPLTKWAGDDKLAKVLDSLLGGLNRLALNPKSKA